MINVLEFNEGKFVVVERFIKTLEGKIYKKLTANDSKPYLSCINTIIIIIVLLIKNTDYSSLLEEIVSNHEAPKFNVGDRVRITKYKFTPKIGPEKNLLLILS